MSKRSGRAGLRERMAARLIESRAELPVRGLSRLMRTGLAAARGGRLLTRGRALWGPSEAARDGEVDVEALIRLVTSIGELKGVAMKLGQILSYVDVALPEEVREALSALQTHAQPMSFEEVRRIVRAELGDRAEPLLEAMSPAPVAAASIGQVHRARLADRGEVAVKVQYPGIARAIESEFGAASIGARLPALLFPDAHVTALVREARERIVQECDYLREAQMQARFAQLFEGHATIRVPGVHRDFSSRRVLTSSFVPGLGLDDYLATGPSQSDRDRAGVALFEFYVGSLFRHRLYNCDPHPGNYLFGDDGSVSVLDYGCSREFDGSFVTKLARLTRAVHADSRPALEQAFVDLGMVRPGAAYDFALARDLVRAFHGPMLRDEVTSIDLGRGLEMRQMVERKMQLMKLRLPGEFLFLFRIRFGLMSVLSRLGSRANWCQLEQRHVGAVWAAST